MTQAHPFNPASGHPAMDDTLARALGLTPDSLPRSTIANADFLAFSLYCPSDDPQVIANLSAKLPVACAALTTNHFWSSGHSLTISPKPFVPAAHVDVNKPHLLASSALPVAECIDDEWFSLWVLKSLTRQLAPHLALAVSDADGQFVLIEAAEHLPSWVDPDAVEHRVWWVGGDLMLIPASVVAHVETEADGAAVVLDDAGRRTELLLAPEAVRKHLDDTFRTIEHSHALDSNSTTSIPATARLPSTRHHHTHMYLPPLAALVLHPSTNTITTISTDQLVAFAIHAVHTRDPVSMRKSRDMPLLIPQTSPNQWVKVTPRLTRYLYALLDSTRVDPVPLALAKAFPADVPPSLLTAGESGDAVSRTRWRAWHNGAKLALGLEMVLCDTMTVAAGVDGWGDARSKIVDFIKSPDAAGMASTPVWDTSKGEDADDWMHVTDEDLQRWSSSSSSPQGKQLDVDAVVKAVNAFGDGESGLDGITTTAAAAAAGESEEEDGDSDSDDELLFDPDKFDSLFTPREHVRPDSDEDMDSAGSDSDLEELMAENLPGYRGDAADAGDDVDEVQALANLLASLEGQEGRTGPAAGLLAHLGFPLPGNVGDGESTSDD